MIHNPNLRPFRLFSLLAFAAAVFFGAMIVRTIVSPTPKPGVSRVRSDMRSLATAIETYKLDHDAYPAVEPFPAEHFAPTEQPVAFNPPIGSGRIRNITTPISYITSEFPDPHSPRRGETFAYYTDGDGWILISPGPDRIYDIVNPATVYTGSEEDFEIIHARLAPYTYDPTNGKDSGGDVWRVKPVREFPPGTPAYDPSNGTISFSRLLSPQTTTPVPSD